VIEDVPEGTQAEKLFITIRDAARMLVALFADLAEVLDWQTALFAEGVVLLHAS
jgi:hypothetical protein